MLPGCELNGAQRSAQKKREMQLAEWNESETNLQSTRRREDMMVNFDRGTVFLAACSQCDLEEVQDLLDRGVDPNTTNIDGLTALHQACIDDNISMVEYLVKNGAEINVSDNEGWSPLHATASCGYIDIASFLIKKDAHIAACNSDGDLPIDIAEGSDMENLLAEAMNNQNINADEARGAEELAMLNDANHWLNDPDQQEEINPQTGATALHVAAVKGYTRVVMALLKAGADPSAADHDGWTPLHGAAHWGQEEVCRLLVDARADMKIRTHQGQRAMDLAEDGLDQILQELEEQQSLKVANTDLIVSNKSLTKRRSSITRMSIEEKDKMVHSASIEERGTALITQIKEDPETDENPKVLKEPTTSETKSVEEVPQEPEKPNFDSEKPAPPFEDMTTTTPPATEDKDKFDELLLYRRASGSDYSLGSASSTSSITDPVSWRAGLRKTGSSSAVSEGSSTDRKLPNIAVQKSASVGFINSKESKVTPSANSTSENSALTKGVPMRTERRPFVSIKDQDRSSYPLSVGRSGYVPYYRRQQMEREAKEEKEAANAATSSADTHSPASIASAATTRTPTGSSSSRTTIASMDGSTSVPAASEDTYSSGSLASAATTRTPTGSSSNRTTIASMDSSTSVPVASAVTPTSSITSVSPSTGSGTPTTPTGSISSSSSRLSRFEAPKRDEDAETNRKIKAKRARETRRSTQGVTQDDVKAAEATLKIASHKNGPVNAETGNTQTAASSSCSANDNPNIAATTTTERPEEGNKRRSWKRRLALQSDYTSEEGARSSFRKARDTIISGSNSTSSVPEAMATTPTYTRPASQRSSTGWRNGTVDDKGEEDSSSKDEDKSKSRTVRSRRNRRERRSTGVIYYDEADNDKDEDTSEINDISPAGMTTTTPGGSATCNNQTTNWSSRPFTSRRYGSASDVPAQMAGSNERGDRSSYTRYNRRQPTTGTALDSNYTDIDIKKVVEEVKSENEKLKSQVKDLQTELSETKSANKSRNNGESLADKRERRALERRCSELEEEIKKLEIVKQDNTRLKEENGALIRVISKLSK